MKVVGIVAEFNPFHNGHKYIIDYAKNKLGADYVIVAMSGNFTQRGEITLFDKHTRAHAALLNGADLIFEIPVIFATASAAEYAACAIKIFKSTNIVDTVLFGSEHGKTADFKEIVDKAIKIEKDITINNRITQLLSKGYSYAYARNNILNDELNTDLLSTPNNILGFEYAKAIVANNYNIEIETVSRISNNYNDLELSGTISSASSIRSAYFKREKYNSATPSNVNALYNKLPGINPNDISEILHYKLINEISFESYMDSNMDLSNRICKSKNDFISFTQYCDLLKTKNITYSRISRLLCHILLDIKKDDFDVLKADGYIKELRLLGFSKNGAKLLSHIKENADFTINTSPTANTSDTDLKATEIYNLILTSKTKATYPTEYTKKFELAGI